MLMIGITLLFGFWATKLRLQEDITTFFPDNTKKGTSNALIFKNLKIKDRLVIMLSLTDSLRTEPDSLVEYSNRFVETLRQSTDTTLVRSIISEIDDEKISKTIDFVYEYLPVYLSDSVYLSLDSMLAGNGLEKQIAQTCNNLMSPMGIAIRDVALRDPFGMGGKALSKLNIFNQYSNFELYDNRIFSKDMRTLLLFVEPRTTSSASSENEKLIDAIEASASQVKATVSESVDIDYYGGPGMAVYNARQIKRDTMITLNVALLIILVFIVFAFRKLKAVILIVAPVIFGAVFALGLVYLFVGKISAIAIGGGAAIMGIALSHSIHVLSHCYHASDVKQVIRDLAYPLTVGSFTTIGAFLGLMFTTSPLLRDFGLFSALLLIGTTLFTLVFLPHFLFFPEKGYSNKLIDCIERITSYPYDRNKWLLGSLCVVFAVSLFYFNDVKFNSDMMKLNFEPAHIKKAEEKLMKISGQEMSSILLISAGADADSALASYNRVQPILSQALDSGKIERFVSASDFFLPSSVQKERIERWNSYWTPERKEAFRQRATKAAVQYGFNDDAFDAFIQMLDKDYSPLDISEISSAEIAPVFNDWVNVQDSLIMFLSQVSIAQDDKSEVYPLFEEDPYMSIVDRSFFIGKMAEAVNSDFYTVLWISSVLIFVALMISYGRIELSLLAFLPMTLSWVIILGIMAVCGVEFNIVNIILSTFIFGIGDDFSIFIMDGLLYEYRTGKKMLTAHKMAIFFSAVTVVVGMGALLFAKHPAIHSLAVISLLGIVAVVLISYVIQPVLFRLLITSQTQKGGFPYTLSGILNSLYCFLLFLLGCIILNILILILKIVPVGKAAKQRFLLYAIHYAVKVFLKCVLTVRFKTLNREKETFQKPAIIIANHQSFIDLLMMLSLTPKMVIVTNSWVWNSPFFGWIVRYAGCLHTGVGSELLQKKIAEKRDEGYSVLIFPEGTRSPDCRIHRFHKGAFSFASELKMDILPVLFYGNGLISSKNQPFYIKKGEIVTEVLPRISSSDSFALLPVKEQAKAMRRLYEEIYDCAAAQYNRGARGYFYDALIKNYTYKGPVLEWYMRVKVMMEERYRFMDELIPRNARVVDIGCGYGPLSLMLSLMSPERNILGVDYDEEKIEVAGKCFSAGDNCQFVYANALEYDFPESDVFVMNDMLHYMNYDAQKILISRCASRLSENGLIIIRDGDRNKKDKHRLTEWSEKWSTEIIRFNKKDGELCFISSELIRGIAEALGLEVKENENDRFTSNTFYLLSRKKD